MTESMASLRATIASGRQANEQLTDTLKMVTGIMNRLDKENTELKEENAYLKKRLGEED